MLGRGARGDGGGGGCTGGVGLNSRVDVGEAVELRALRVDMSEVGVWQRGGVDVGEAVERADLRQHVAEGVEGSSSCVDECAAEAAGRLELRDSVRNPTKRRKACTELPDCAVNGGEAWIDRSALAEVARSFCGLGVARVPRWKDRQVNAAAAVQGVDGRTDVG